MSEVVTMRQLLEAGVHFGHQTKRWNPRMKRYIFTSRNGIHVIDLQQTIKLIKKVYSYVRETVKHNGTVLMVGTKKQAQDAIQSEAERCQMPYINHRWLGGTLTNNVTLRQSINKLKHLKRIKEEGMFDELSNKESSKKQKTLNRLSFYLDGIKDMIALPSVIFIVDTKKEQLAVKEATRLGIPIIGIVDTNADPTEVQFPIPANDDAIRAIKLICSVISQAVLDGQKDAAELAAAQQLAQEQLKKEQEALAAEEEKKKKVVVAKKEEKSEKEAPKKDSKKDDKKEAVVKAKKTEAKEEKKAEEEKPAKKVAEKKTTKKATTKAADKKEEAEEKPAKKTTKAAPKKEAKETVAKKKAAETKEKAEKK